MTILDGVLQGVTPVDQSFARSDSANYVKAYSATDPNNPTPVALKALRVSPNDATRLRNSIQAHLPMWERLSHPNVTPFLGLYQDEYHLAALVLPYYENRNILHYIQKNPNADKLSLIKGVAEGLKYLHMQRPAIIHADIRGSNVLVDDAGIARLVDFGLVYILSGFSLTATSILGPARWQGPEILSAENGLPFTLESDVYSFAMLVVEVLTQNKPYPRSTDIAVMRLVQAGKRPRKPANMPLAHELWPILERCWNAEPAARPSMSEVCEMLHLLAGH